MAHVRLAAWHGGNPPGTVVEVRDDAVAGLRKDGRVAEVVDGPDPVPAPAEAAVKGRRVKSAEE